MRGALDTSARPEVGLALVPMRVGPCPSYMPLCIPHLGYEAKRIILGVPTRTRRHKPASNHCVVRASRGRQRCHLLKWLCGRSNNATSCACRCVLVLANTDFSWPRAVEMLTPRASAIATNVLPAAMPMAIWASAGVRRNRERKDASKRRFVLLRPFRRL